MQTRFSIVGLGEALFDIFPDQQCLGGAPLNVAVHAQQLARDHGGRGVIVSRIGQDELGEQLIQQLHSRGMPTEYIQSDPDHDTGKVYVALDEHGQPRYEIASDVAWDWLQWDPDLEGLARQCEAVCFGSLAQRNAQSRNTVYRFLDLARRAIRLFDVNLRQNFYNIQMLTRSCELATAVKLNESELSVLADLLSLPQGNGSDVAEEQSMALLRKFKLKLVALTRSERGTVLFTTSGRYQSAQPVRYGPSDGADAVGAGDACTAGLLVGMALRLPPERIVALADHAGAFVASQPGATPELPEAIRQTLRT